MHTRQPLLDPANVQHGIAAQFDLFPAQIDKLGGAQPVPKSHKDHGGVTKAVAIIPSGLDQPVNLGLGQVRGYAARRSFAVSAELSHLRCVAAPA